MRAHFDHILAERQLAAPQIVVETSATPLAESIILRGGFLAVTSLAAADEWAARGRARILSIDVPPMSDPVNLIWSERAPMAQPAKIFLAFVRSQIKLEFGAERKAANA